MAHSLRFAICALVVLGFARPGFAKDKKVEPDEVDYVALGARLVQDGHYDRASEALEMVDESDEELDKKLYYVLKGLVALNQKLYVAAADSFQSAISAGNTDPLVYINLGQAHYGAKDYKGAIDAMHAAGKAALDEPRAELLVCQSYWELGDAKMALASLGRATKRFPESIELARLELNYLIKLQLYQTLTSRVGRFLERSDVEARDLAAMGEGLRKSRQLDEAKAILEVARLRFPDDLGLTVQLSRVFMDAGEFLSAGMLLEQAARLDDKYLVESAEMYRRGGQLVRALFINKRVPDQKSKMRQRLQILLELERFEMISGMEERLSRLGLLEDQQIRYALAYGFFQTRDFASADKHIRELSDPSYFDKGIALRKAIESCKEAGWLCE